MRLLDLILRFRKDEDGAVTVDWVVLTAALVALAVGVGIFITSSLDGVADTIADNLSAPGYNVNQPVAIGSGG